MRDGLSSEVAARVRERAAGRTVLLGVSGGRDSMVLWAMLRAHDVPHAVAHVDYRLRGAESDADRDLVVSTAETHGVACHVITNVDFTADASNLQSRARALRRAAFERLSREHGYGLTLLAHHADDQLETILLGLVRGGGPRALAAMQVWRAPYLRPLLFSPRADIDAYAKARGVAYREDSTNSSAKYLRNRLRHDVVPRLLEVRPNARAAALASAEVLNHLLEFTEPALVDSIEACRAETAGHRLLRAGLAQTSGLPYVLWHLLRKFNPTSDLITTAVRLIGSGSEAPDWRRRNSLAIRESHALVITEKFVWLEERVVVADFAQGWTLDDSETSWPIRLHAAAHGSLSIGPATADDKGIGLSPNYFTIGYAPGTRLVWRTARRTDRLAAGDGRHTRVRSVLAQAGLPPVSSGRATVLTVDDEVAWVVGVRRSSSYKNTPPNHCSLVITIAFEPRPEPYGVVRLSS